MTDIAAADFAVSALKVEIVGRKKRATGTLTLTGGTSVYTTAGLALPAIGNFGFARQMDSLHLSAGLGSETTAYMPRYTGSTHKLQLFEEEGTAAGGPLLEADTGEAPGTRVWYFEAWGW
jgi:hypothetical protein